MNQKNLVTEENVEIPETLPVLPISSAVVFPYAIIQLLIHLEKNKELFNFYHEDSIICVVTPKNRNTEKIKPKDLYKFGVAAKILDIVDAGGGALQIVLQGLCRVQIQKMTQEQPYFEAEIERVHSHEIKDSETSLLQNDVLESFHNFIAINPRYSAEIVRVVEMKMGEGPGVMCDLISSYLNFKIEDKQKILECLEVKERLKLVRNLLNKETEFVKVESDIQDKAREDMAKSQREYFLRRQLEQIKRELGEEESGSPDIVELKRRIKDKKFTAEVEALLHKEVKRLEEIRPSAADYNILRSYLEWVISLPWTEKTTDNLNIKQVKVTLDEDHYGLEEVKERILEYLAVLKLKRDLKGPILCLVGPPGVCKTSLGQSIARALGRQFVRISLGGVRDEAEIRGHRRTYVGALPGRIIQGMKK